MSNEIQFLLYNMPDAEGSVQVVIRDETLWCTQKAMAQLFGVGVPAVSKHLKNIFEEGELSADSVVSKMEITAADGKNYETSYYSIDAIIGHTAAEIIYSKSDHTKENMGLTTWKYAPDGRILKISLSAKTHSTCSSSRQA